MANSRESRFEAALDTLSRPSPLISRLLKMLRTVNGLDRMLMLISYTSRLLYPFILRSSKAGSGVIALYQLMEKGGVISSSVSWQRTGSKMRVEAVGHSLQNLTGATSDVRTALRCFGLIETLRWAQSHLQKTRTNNNGFDIVVEWVRIAAIACYFPLEHLSWLVSKRIVFVDPILSSKLAVWSVRFWAVDVILGILTSLKHSPYTLKQLGTADEKGADSTAAVASNTKRVWLRDLAINLNYLPLTIHWSMYRGILSDEMVGLFGTVAALGQFSKAWDLSA